MKLNKKTSKILLIIAFSLLSVASIITFIASALFILFGIGYVGDAIAFLEIAWMLRTLVLLAILSVVAIIGFAKEKIWGAITGASIATAGFIAMHIFLFSSLIKGTYSISEILIYLAVAALAIFLLICINKFVRSIAQIKKHYIIIAGILCIFILFLHFCISG